MLDMETIEENDGALQEPLDAPEIEVQPPPQSPDAVIDRDAIAREAIQSAATRAGWVPKEQYRGPANNWVDADEFLAGVPTRFEQLRDQNRRLGQVVDQTVQEARQKGRDEAIADLKRASESGDPEALVRATEKLVQVTDGHGNIGNPQVEVWKVQNPWFASHAGARALAANTTEETAKMGYSVPEQLAAAEREVRQRFPELFTKPVAAAPPAPAAPEAPQRPAPRIAPAVQGGQRTAAPQLRTPTIKDLPAPMQQAFRQHFAHIDGMTEEKYVAQYLRNTTPER